MADLDDVLGRIKARADTAYCHYIGLLRRDVCLGQKIKFELHSFGETELNAHCEAAEVLGKHRAFHEILKMIRDSMAEESEISSLADTYVVQIKEG